MIGRITTPIEVPNDQAWDTFGFRCWITKANPWNVATAEGYMRLFGNSQPKIDLSFSVVGNEVGLDVSDTDMADIAPGTYALEIKLIGADGTTRQIRGSVIVLGES